LKKEGKIKKSLIKGDTEIIAVDLPGAYSMSPFTSEESITSGFVKNEKPDVIINIVDGTNLSRSLFFTTQLLELGIPVVVALNKSDVNKKKGTRINVKTLSEKLQCPVVETISTAGSNNGLEELISATVNAKGKQQQVHFDSSAVNMVDKSAVEADVGSVFHFTDLCRTRSWRTPLLVGSMDLMAGLGGYLEKKYRLF